MLFLELKQNPSVPLITQLYDVVPPDNSLHLRKWAIEYRMKIYFRHGGI
jgi:hypothetical protein